jgi:hypothetical protein
LQEEWAGMGSVPWLPAYVPRFQQQFVIRQTSRQ